MIADPLMHARSAATMIAPPLCHFCKHLRRDAPWGTPVACDAFPGGIPTSILEGRVDHRKPIAGDNGIQFELAAGKELPVTFR